MNDIPEDSRYPRFSAVAQLLASVGSVDGRIKRCQAEQSESIGALALALAKAQGEITGAAKGSSNPFFKSKYADLAACWDACRGPLTDNEIAVIQTTETNGDGVTIVTTLAHSSGEWIRGKLTMTPDKPGPQALGSCITYGRRYALAGIVGLAQVDDDAEAATSRITMSKQKETKIRKALDEAMQKEDHLMGYETWTELDVEERKFIWESMDDRFYKKQMNEFLKAAEKMANGDTEPAELSPKDQRREKARATA